MKRCPNCGIEKPRVEYSENRAQPHGLQTYCKVCRRLKSKLKRQISEPTPKRVTYLIKYRAEHKTRRQSSEFKIARRARSKVHYQKRKGDPKYRLNKAFSTHIRRALKGTKNGKHWGDLVDYNVEDLIKHLEAQFQVGMSWESWGKYGWHIDHIRPKSSFDYTSTEDPEFQECWALDNLQPMWWRENIIKGRK